MLPRKSEFFGNLPGKSGIFNPDPRPPQISNQIDAADGELAGAVS